MDGSRGQRLGTPRAETFDWSEAYGLAARFALVPIRTDDRMFLLRFIFKSGLMWVITRLLGRFLPVLARLLRLIGF